MAREPKGITANMSWAIPDWIRSIVVILKRFRKLCKTVSDITIQGILSN